jgi:hypothetical protein
VSRILNSIATDLQMAMDFGSTVREPIPLSLTPNEPLSYQHVFKEPTCFGQHCIR